MKKYVLMYRREEVQGIFNSLKSIEKFRKDNEIPKEIFEEEFEAIKTDFYN